MIVLVLKPMCKNSTEQLQWHLQALHDDATEPLIEGLAKGQSLPVLPDVPS